jgi:hypothetical protein
MYDLWVQDAKFNKEYFKWKYHDNPHTAEPLGIVALHNNEVVGFRGYFAEQWQVKNKQFKVLVAGDTCVATKHRRKNLSVAMGNKAIDEYASDYDVFLNFAGTLKSKRGYEKLGFLPLVDKYDLERYAHRDDQQPSVFPISPYINAGRFGDVLVSATPHVQEMYDLSSKESNGGVFSLVQNREFFEWRFKNKRNKYIFCYHIRNNVITDYVVFGTSNDFKKGHILDYTENNIDDFEKIIKDATTTKFFDVLTVGNFGLSPAIAESLHGLGFKPNTETHREIIPVWVRPLKRDCTDRDWFIKGLDIRKIKNWKMKGICSEWL